MGQLKEAKNEVDLKEKDFDNINVELSKRDQENGRLYSKIKEMENVSNLIDNLKDEYALREKEVTEREERRDEDKTKNALKQNIIEKELELNKSLVESYKAEIKELKSTKEGIEGGKTQLNETSEKLKSENKLLKTTNEKLAKLIPKYEKTKSEVKVMKDNRNNILNENQQLRIQNEALEKELVYKSSEENLNTMKLAHERQMSKKDEQISKLVTSAKEIENKLIGFTSQYKLNEELKKLNSLLKTKNESLTVEIKGMKEHKPDPTDISPSLIESTTAYQKLNINYLDAMKEIKTAEERHRLQVLFLQKENNHLKETSEASEQNSIEIKKSLESVIEIKKANKVLTDDLETIKRKLEERRNHASKLNDIILGLETTVQEKADTIEEVTKKSYELQTYKTVVSCLKDKVSKLDNELVELKKENKDLYSSQIETFISLSLSLLCHSVKQDQNTKLEKKIKIDNETIFELTNQVKATYKKLEEKDKQVYELNNNIAKLKTVVQIQNV